MTESDYTKGMMPKAGRTVCKTEPHEERDLSIPQRICNGLIAIAETHMYVDTYAFLLNLIIV